MHIYNAINVEDEEKCRVQMKKDFANTIKKIRLSKNMTQEQVAELAGINPKYLGEIERGLKSPTVVVVRKLADALSVPICSIMSARACPCNDAGISQEVAFLLDGKKEKEVKKVLKLIELFFE